MKLVLFVVLISVGAIDCGGLLPAGEILKIDPIPVDDITDISIITNKLVKATANKNVATYNHFVQDRIDFTFKLWLDIVLDFKKQGPTLETNLKEDSKPLLDKYGKNKKVKQELNNAISKLSSAISTTGESVVGNALSVSNHTIGLTIYMMNDVEETYRNIKTELDFKQGTCLLDFENHFWKTTEATNTCLKNGVFTMQTIYYDWLYFVSDIRKSFNDWLNDDYLKGLSNQEIMDHINTFSLAMTQHIEDFVAESGTKTKSIEHDAYKCFTRAYILNRNKSSFGRSQQKCLK